MKIKNWKLASRIERNGRRRSLRRPKLSTIKESLGPGIIIIIIIIIILNRLRENAVTNIRGNVSGTGDCVSCTYVL